MNPPTPFPDILIRTEDEVLAVSNQEGSIMTTIVAPGPINAKLVDTYVKLRGAFREHRANNTLVSTDNDDGTTTLRWEPKSNCEVKE